MSNGSTASEWVPTGSVTVRVPGKVNLYLEVGDRRDDGYHELTTVFHAVSLLDEITVRNADVLSLELAGEGADTLPTDERNLAWRAAELLADHVGRAPDVAITVEKSIPVAGGMAGGSANAAAVLVAMNTLWELGVPRRDLHALAAQLGSDVPFALHGGTALGTGRGEELATVLARNTFHWVLAFAVGGLSTPSVFAEIDRLRETSGSDREAPPRLDDPEPVLAALASGDPAAAGAAARQRLATGGTEPRPRTAPHPARRHRRRGAGGHRFGLRADVCVPLLIGVRGGRRGHTDGRRRGLSDGARRQWPRAGRAGGACAVGLRLTHPAPRDDGCDPGLNTREILAGP